MNTSLFLSLSLGCLGALATFFCATPAMAQGDQNIPASGYGTGENIEISGWQNGLVQRNPGLEKFHWSPINTVQHYRVVSVGAVQKPGMKPVSAYHNVKPHVSSTWASTKGPVVDKSCIASLDVANHASVSAAMRSSYNSQPAQYGAEKITDNKVCGRVLHY